jgi:predicted neuraminidase
VRTPEAIAKLSLLVIIAGTAANAQIREFISDEMPTPSCHASTLVELSNGDLLASWFGGTREGAPDVAIWQSRRTAAGWSTPRAVMREPGIATYNPVLFYSANGVLWFYYKFGPHPSSWTAGRTFSRDEGHTWAPIEHLPAGLYGPIRAKPLVLSDGTILSGTSVESYGSWACWIERSIDQGQTWQRIGPIAAPYASAVSQPKTGQSYGIIQPSLVDLGGKHIRLYARSTESIGRICQADSFDAGLTWSEVKTTTLPNPNSGIDAIRLRDGRLVMIYNRSTHERTPLTLALSHHGDQWKDFYDLETGPGEYSYPALIEARNGDLLMTFTWRREKIRFVRYPLAKIPR